MPHALLLVACAVFGLVVGSFLNVVVWRVPRHEELVRPGAHCRSCDTEVGAIENVPVWSCLVLPAGLVALSLIDLDHFLRPIRVLYPTGIIMAALFVIPAIVDGQGDDY